MGGITLPAENCGIESWCHSTNDHFFKSNSLSQLKLNSKIHLSPNNCFILS
jgi:hypothetical protein